MITNKMNHWKQIHQELTDSFETPKEVVQLKNGDEGILIIGKIVNSFHMQIQWL